MTQISNVETFLFILIGINSLLIIWSMSRVTFLEKSMNEKMNAIQQLLKEIRDDNRTKHFFSS